MKNTVVYLLLIILLASCENKPLRQVYVENISELESAISNAIAGDEIIMSDGVWRDLQLNFHAFGTADNPIILRAETPGGVSVEGQSYIKLAGEYLHISGLEFKNGYSPINAIIEFRIDEEDIANNCTVSDCVIDGFVKPKKSSPDHWVVFWGQHNSINKCYIAGKYNQGPTVKVFLQGNQHINNYHKITNNYFGPRPRKGGAMAETIQIGASNTSMTPSHTIISNNYFDRCNGEVEVISNKSNNCEIRNNVFFECEGSVVLRHGNYCIVDGNTFIGNIHSPFTGGIRVINTGHWITNNYFYQVNGQEFRAPLAIMNGIPNSALNRYNQVTDVVVSYNTWVDCPTPWQISVGANVEKLGILPASEIRSARPLRVEITNNIVYNRNEGADLIKRYDKADEGIVFRNNIVSIVGYEGTETEGISLCELSFEQKNNWLLTPVNENTDILENVYNGFGYEELEFDMFGSRRSETNNVGAIIPSGISNDMQGKEAYGPSWFNWDQDIKEAKVYVAKTGDEFRDALKASDDGDTVKVEGEIEISSTLPISKKITLASTNIEKKAVIRYSGQEDTPLFEMQSSACLVVDNLVLKGKEKQFAFASAESGMKDTYSLFVKGSEIENFATVLKAYKDSMADTLYFSESVIRSCRNGLLLAAETDARGDYNAEHVEIAGCSFEKISDSVIDFYRGGYDESTIGGVLKVRNCFFTSCGRLNKNGILLKTTGIINVAIDNNTFSSNPIKYIAVLWGEKNNTHSNNTIANSGEILVEEFLKQTLLY